MTLPPIVLLFALIAGCLCTRPVLKPPPLPLKLAGGLFLFRSSVPPQRRPLADALLQRAQAALRADPRVTMELGMGIEAGGVFASAASADGTRLVLNFQLQGGNLWAESTAYGIVDGDGELQLAELSIANMDAAMMGESSIAVALPSGAAGGAGAPRASNPRMAIDDAGGSLMDAVFFGSAAALAASTAYLFSTIYQSPRSVDRGLGLGRGPFGSAGLSGGGGGARAAAAPAEESSMLGKIRAARATNAPGFVWDPKIDSNGPWGDGGADADADGGAAGAGSDDAGSAGVEEKGEAKAGGEADARLRSSLARDALSAALQSDAARASLLGRLAEAVEKQDVAAAASLKRELDALDMDS